MCYASHYELEDHVFCIKTECSDASTPEPRAGHIVTNMEVLTEHGDEVDARYNFHTFSHRYRITDYLFGMMFVTLHRMSDDSLIASKKIVLKNDYTWRVLDVYHV